MLFFFSCCFRINTHKQKSIVSRTLFLSRQFNIQKVKDQNQSRCHRRHHRGGRYTASTNTTHSTPPNQPTRAIHLCTQTPHPIPIANRPPSSSISQLGRQRRRLRRGVAHHDGRQVEPPVLDAPPEAPRLVGPFLAPVPLWGQDEPDAGGAVGEGLHLGLPW